MATKESEIIEWDDSKANDKSFLIRYYNGRIQRWKDNPKGIKIVRHYQNAIKELSK